MKYASFNQTKKFANSSQCSAFEYPIKDPAINAVVVEVNGRYPDTGFAMNQTCKELVYVLSGSGQLVVQKQPPIELNQGDVILIDPGELFYWTGSLTMFMPCTPAWYPQQHQLVAG